MKIVVTGAFSYSGKYITRRLLARGEQIITFTNHPDRGDPFGGQVVPYPLDFNDPQNLSSHLQGVDALINTYWVRFDRGGNTQPRAVENTRILIKAAASAGVNRIVHISITNPSPDSHLPYFSGKAANEQAVIDSGMSYAILRPTVLFGSEDILINNIAWILRRFPILLIPGDGKYRLQPVYVDDLADLVVKNLYDRTNRILDSVGPDIFTFREMVSMIATQLGITKPLINCPPALALLGASLIGIGLGDVVLTPEEVDGLMAGLLVSKDPPLCQTRLADWLRENKNSVGTKYASEISRHYG